ncbi:ATP-binding cassette subfamily C member 4-like [Centruroides vittatus]|uniref:ATP-binding cassette subfamily C member 4-like n=1 Tax=Centruroides vittatus TaxID=120091 RepID=UPI00350FCB07
MASVNERGRESIIENISNESGVWVIPYLILTIPERFHLRIFSKECFLVIFPAYWIGILAEYFNNKTYDNIFAYLAAAGVCCFTAVYGFIVTELLFRTSRLDMKIRIACSGAVYRKALRLSYSSLGKSSVGQMVNLLSNDVNKFNNCTYLSTYVITGPIQLVITIWILIVLYFPLQIKIGKMFSKQRLESAKLGDRRLRLLHELITGIRIIKMYTWEKAFAKNIEAARRAEMNRIKTSLLLSGPLFAVGFLLSKSFIFFPFLTFYLTGGKITAGLVFMTVSLTFNIYRSLFFALPQAVNQISEALLSIKRLQNFLLLEEKEESSETSDCEKSLDKCEVRLERISTSWNKDSGLVLRDTSLHATSGDLIVVVGPVGSGKTSMLLAILGELPILSGRMNIKGRIAYASQEPWIFGGTIRDNILFGKDYDEIEYRKILHVSALEKDVKQFPDGDLTFVGERGEAMSGGQKARINLARALYLDADIYILDDPLSAVDAPVAKHIFEKCIMGHLKNKIRILATHQVRFTKQATKIVALKEGKCKSVGDYQHLSRIGINLGQNENDDEVSYSTETEFSNEEMSNFSQTYNEISTRMPCNDDQGINEEKMPNDQREHKGKGLSIKTTFINPLKFYLDAGMGKILQLILIFLFILNQCLTNGNDYYLAKWSSQNRRNINKTLEELSANGTIDWEIVEGRINKSAVFIYSGLFCGSIVLSLLSSVTFLVLSCRSSINVHNNTLRSMIQSQISFIENNSIGKIFNRFSTDTGIIDTQLPITNMKILMFVFSLLGMCAVEAKICPYLIMSSVVLALALVFLWTFCKNTSVGINRFEAKRRSPIFNHLGNTLSGLLTIRAGGCQRNFENILDSYLNRHSSVWFLLIAVDRTISLYAFVFANLHLAITTVILFLVPSSTVGGEIGLAISYGTTVAFNSVMLMITLVEEESQMMSVANIYKFNEALPKDFRTTKCHSGPPADWPAHGVIKFDNVCLRYSNKENFVLKNLNFLIGSGEKIGIVGRTGAGKSSLIAALFRLTEPTGSIFVDGVNIGDIDLHQLRSKLSVIPQVPLLFGGSLRRNLDPLKAHDDTSLWKVLESVGLKEVVGKLSGGLDSELIENGGNFSIGERQLICLARTLLSRNKIIIVDEATANVDKRTDLLMQKTIRENFSFCTILTIAHRVQSIMDSDRVMVLEEGRIREFDKPCKLLENKDGIFYNMVRMSGLTATKCLRNIEENKNNNIQITKEVSVKTEQQHEQFVSPEKLLRLKENNTEYAGKPSNNLSECRKVTHL